MNKKGKNKKGKVPNPVPAQEEKAGDKVEDVVIGDKGDLGKTSDIIENVPGKTESVKEDRVPEIVKEVLTAPVDTKDEETPKKPKRNRGKKKKGKDDDFDDNIEEGSKESNMQPPPTEDPKVEVSEIEKETLDMPTVTPTARKKKNKKKNVEHKSEEPIASELESISPPADNLDTTKDLEPTDTLLKPEITTQSEQPEQEVKSSKKKNKKKKSTDSERSDREEISCTAAFQKLMDVGDETSEVKAQEHTEDNVITAEDIKFESEVQKSTDASQKPATVVDTEVMLCKEKDVHQVSVSESKNKKKNKKDKKNIPKPDEITPLLDEPVTELTLPVKIEESLDAVTKEDAAKELSTTEKSECLVEETSPKPKAKIAKPVEKKRKGKQDNKTAESLPQEITASAEAPKEEELFPEVVLETPEITSDEKEIISDIETKNISEEAPVSIPIITMPTPDQLKEITLADFEPLNLTDKAMGKKRKKGPKIPKTPDVSFEIFESNVESPSKESVEPNIETTFKEPVQSNIESFPKKPVPETIETKSELPAASKSEVSKPEQVYVPSEITEVQTLTDLPTDAKPIATPITLTGVKDHILLTPEIAENKDFMKAESTVSGKEKAEDAQKFEMKSGKKRKKSPKPPKKEKVPEAEDLTTKSSKPSEECPPKPDATKDMGERIDASNITKMYDIEISSIKADESEGSLCDTIPDVTYPRASSQQLTDDNNNDTVIREIFPVSEIITGIPVQECVKTPKADITVTQKEHNVSPSQEEKTDLKSKMMEVNQDMEELRLSIERSLAELTAMEKSEEVMETRFEESKSKTVEDITKVENIETIQKKEDHEKMIKISDAEKSAIEKPAEEIKRMDIQDSNKKIDDQPTTLSSDQSVISMFKENIKTEPVKVTETGTERTITEVGTKAEVKVTQAMIGIKKIPEILMPFQEKTAETSVTSDTTVSADLLPEHKKVNEIPIAPTPIILPEERKVEQTEPEKKEGESKPKEEGTQLDTLPVCPARKDHKNKHKKKKGKQDSQVSPTQPAQSAPSTTTSQTTTQETKKDEKTDNKTDNKSEKKSDSKGKGKQQSSNLDPVTEKDLFSDMDYEPIENFEDALTSSVDDVNKTFEMIVNESQEQSNPKINIIAPDEEKSHVSPPKNLLGHPDIPVPSNRRDFKKEKNKIPNEITAKVKIKDAVDVEKKQSKNTQTINKLKDLKDCRLSDNEDFVYKYSFRKVFLQTACHVCNKDLAGCRVACCYCNLVFYCGIKHKDEDWPQHQALCFAVSTIGHLKDQKHIYGDAKNITGHDYRLIRMQMIVSCEKVLKRRLVPWEQEALLYPRICAHAPCREWRQMKLTDCQGCGQISYCTEHPDHCPKSHARWCKSYSLYQKLVSYQQTKGRLEPKLPTKVMQEHYEIPEKINEVLAAMYEEKIGNLSFILD